MAENTSTRKRPLVSIAIWSLVAIVLISILIGVFNRDGYQQIDTQQGLELLEGGTVEQAKIIDGNQQRVDLVLTESYVSTTPTRAPGSASPT